MKELDDIDLLLSLNHVSFKEEEWISSKELADLILKEEKPQMITKYWPYTAFGKTVNLPVQIYYRSKLVEADSWEEELWIERTEDWYALSSPQLHNKFVRVVEAEDFRCEVDMGRYQVE